MKTNNKKTAAKKSTKKAAKKANEYRVSVIHKDKKREHRYNVLVAHAEESVAKRKATRFIRRRLRAEAGNFELVPDLSVAKVTLVKQNVELHPSVAKDVA